MTQTHHDHHQTDARWPAHLRSEPTVTRMGRSTRVGLGLTGAALAGLMVVSWSGAVPAPEQPSGPTPVAVTSR